MKIDIMDLAASCLTRLRAAEAFQALAERDDGTDLVLSLHRAPFLSVSFLDELVGLLDQAGILPRITFEPGSQEHVGKLGRVRDVRGVELFQMVEGERKLIPVKAGLTLVTAPPSERPPDAF